MIEKQANSNNVYVFSDIVLTVGGTDYNVSSIKIVLAENTMPAISITIDPVHVLNESMATATTSNLDFIKNLHDKFQDYAQRRVAADFRFKTQRNDTKDVQELKLTNWRCTAAGFGGLSIGGSLAITVEIRHPVTLMNSGATVLGNQSEFDDPYTSAGSGVDIVDTMANIAEYLAGLERITKDKASKDDSEASACGDAGDAATVDEIWRGMQTRMLEATQAFRDTVEWDPDYDGNKWPLEDCASEELLQGIKLALVPYFDSGEQFNLWDVLINNVVPTYMLTLVPTYTSAKLKLRPYGYWSEPSLTIAEHEIADFTLPSTDITPILGVVMSFRAVASAAGWDTMRYSDAGIDNYTYSDIMYVPAAYLPAEGGAEGDAAVGKLVRLGPPLWFLGAVRLAAQLKSGAIKPADAESWVTLSATAGTDDNQASDAVETYAAEEAANKAALYRIAKASFERMFKSSYQFQVKTRLMVMQGKDPVIPGVVARVQTESGATFCDFYVTHIVHVIDVQSQQAFTELTGTHMRSEGEYKDVVGTGSPNSLYGGGEPAATSLGAPETLADVLAAESAMLSQ